MTAKLKGSLCLLLCAIFWGMCFSAQSDAAQYIGPYTFVWLRSTITCLVLTAAYPVLNRLGGSGERAQASGKQHLIVGALCGTFLVLATILQQIGLMTTTTAKSGFITALYIVIVPLMGILLKRRPPKTIWIGVAISLVGLYFLCGSGASSLCIGDLFTFGSALVFAIHITLIDRYGGSLDSVRLSAIQFGTAAVIAGVLTFLFETPTLDGVLACWMNVAYAAVFSGALGYTLQIVGQKTTDPTLASLIMCLEAVFAAFGGWLLLGETLSGTELLGCALMLSASVVAQLPEKKRHFF